MNLKFRSDETSYQEMFPPILANPDYERLVIGDVSSSQEMSRPIMASIDHPGKSMSGNVSNNGDNGRESREGNSLTPASETSVHSDEISVQPNETSTQEVPIPVVASAEQPELESARNNSNRGIPSNNNGHVNVFASSQPHADGPSAHQHGPTAHSDGPVHPAEPVHSDGPTAHSDGPTVHSDGPSAEEMSPSPPIVANADQLGLDSPGGIFDDDLGDDFKQQQRKGLKWLVASGLLGIVAVGSLLFYTRLTRFSAEPVAVTTAPLQRETLTNQVDASGVVELGGQQTIKAPSDVTVEAILVNEQQRVATGEVLLVLRDRALQEQIEAQQVEQQINILEIQRQKERFQQQESLLSKAQQRLAESQSLADRGFISQDEYDQDQDRLDDATLQLRSAQIDVKQAELTLQQNQVKLNSLKAQLADNQIQSPFDATVLQIEVQPGDGVPREKPLLTIGDPAKETIRFQITVLDAQKVQPGMQVNVSVIGPNPKKYGGRVVWIAPRAIREPGDAGQSQPKVDAIAVLDQPSGELIPGSTVSLEITIEQSEDVWAVPLNSVVNEGDRQYVWVRDVDGKAQKREVKLGIQTLDKVEIVSGFEAEDTLLESYPPELGLEAGMPLDIEGEE